MEKIKRIFVAKVICLFPFFTQADITFSSELLIGSTFNDIHSSTESERNKNHFLSNLNEQMLGLRLGVNVMENLSIELAKYHHGDSHNEVTITIPKHFPVGNEIEELYQVKVPVELDSLRLGLKAQKSITEQIFINAGLGVAYWQYDKHTPLKLSYPYHYYDMDKSGYDFYFSLGMKYQFNEHAYLGAELALLRIHESAMIDDMQPLTHTFKHDVKDVALILGWQF